MNEEELAQCWNNNATTWTKLVREGYDVLRDHLNTPCFFDMLPKVNNLSGLDIGCGEGHNTRLLAERCAQMSAIDISEIFIAYAKEASISRKLCIDYFVGNAICLPFANCSFDFVTGFMSFMDIPDTDKVVSEAFRVLKPGGFLQFSITHPCFYTRHRRFLQSPDGLFHALEVGDYFSSLEGEIREWIFEAVPQQYKEQLPKFKTLQVRRTLSEWLNILLKNGFIIERVEEPCPTNEQVHQCNVLQIAQITALFLHIRTRKPMIE